MVNRTDEELLPALAKGNEEAFTVVYRRRQGAIYRYALQMTGSAETASEATAARATTVRAIFFICFSPELSVMGPDATAEPESADGQATFLWPPRVRIKLS
jgi:hypothetical protein